MPNAPRRQDTDPSQEWATDTSNDGQPSGNLSLEVAFNNDDPDGEWTTHLINPDFGNQRLSTQNRTAIMIEGLSWERQRALTLLVHGEHPARTKRGKILGLLAQDPDLRWVA
ncbi:hypothetical protein KJ742_00955 [Patescibacteria group bacterium]|nr:hypothetical protein [Patescibacteria group bacterium]MBU1682492.1 hypothetical protein [Patescibacteria group bacterium]MBU1935278.1 hypothetical protein [Patescibacteria group bacterium]